MMSERINQISNELIDFAALVESMINKSVEGLVKKDENLLREVIKKDEDTSNRFETRMDEMIFQFIAQYEPKAIDLRRALMMLQMSNDLERIGDHAVNICESSLILIEQPMIKEYREIPKMAKEVSLMLKESIDAFVRMDVKLAEDVCKKDEIVDELRKNIADELTIIMKSDPSSIERAMHLNRIAANLERIADLSTNIGEDVIFIENGKVVKHHFISDWSQ